MAHGSYVGHQLGLFGPWKIFKLKDIPLTELKKN